jgi:hypothetical protein
MNAPKAARGHSGGVFPGQPCKIGVAPGSGSARGLAHIGVMRTIREAGIQMDVVAGTCMGPSPGPFMLPASWRARRWKTLHVRSELGREPHPEPPLEDLS